MEAKLRCHFCRSSASPSNMKQILTWVFLVLTFFFFPTINSETEDVKRSLVEFMGGFSPGNVLRDSGWGWNTTSDPCNDKWVGVTCDSQLRVRTVVLNGLNLTGVLDAASLCTVKSLRVLSLKSNKIFGLIPEEIGKCGRLDHLYVSGNWFSGDIPDALSQLSNLKRLDISNNNFTGELPDLSRISGLLSFWAENNELSGGIPNFDFSNLEDFNVSNNNFSGPIPDVKLRFSADSFAGNPGLCGEPLSVACPPSQPPKKKSKYAATKWFLIYSGYALLFLIVCLFLVLKLVSKKKPKTEDIDKVKKGMAVDNSTEEPSYTCGEFKISENKSKHSVVSVDNEMVSSSLVVLIRPAVKQLRFEELLQAPAELLGRGKYGSLYKVKLDNGLITLVVKRIKDWSISSKDFRSRMQMLDQVRHPNVLPAVAFYCSRQEKLLVYKYLQNGSLFSLLHGSQNGQQFSWESRLCVAASVAEALAFMHRELSEDGIAHGNLKSTNILFDDKMDPQVSEYGLMVVEKQDQALLAQSNSLENNDSSGEQDLRVDVYSFGVILLEILTGKLVQNNGFDLASWVLSVLREEWTVEVFDRALISECASEERMVNLLQVALKCIDPVPGKRPSMNQVAVMINSIKGEEERSICSEP